MLPVPDARGAPGALFLALAPESPADLRLQYVHGSQPHGHGNFVAKLAHQRSRIYEMGISYHGRTYAEGKKIGVRDAVRALYCVLQSEIQCLSGSAAVVILPVSDHRRSGGGYQSRLFSDAARRRDGGVRRLCARRCSELPAVYLISLAAPVAVEFRRRNNGLPSRGGGRRLDGAVR